MRNSITSLVDTPIINPEGDMLGYATVAKQVAQDILFLKPAVVGIIGEWGSGKTSFMNLIKYCLEKEKEETDGWSIRTVWMDLWYLSQFNMTEEAIFQEILKIIDPRTEEYKILKEILPKISKHLFLFGLKTAGLPENLTDVFEDILTYDEVQKLVTTLKNLSTRLSEEDIHVVLFMDDLDRVEPSQLIKSITIIKAFLAHQDITVVIGYDPHVLKIALKSSLGKINPEHFLDKVFDIRYVVPKPSPEKYEEFLMSLVRSQRTLFSESPLKGKKLNFSILARVLRYNPRKAKRVASLLKRSREYPPEKYPQRYLKFFQKYLMVTLYVATLEIVSPSMILDIRDEISNIRGNKELMKALLKFASEEL